MATFDSAQAPETQVFSSTDSLIQTLPTVNPLNDGQNVGVPFNYANPAGPISADATSPDYQEVCNRWSPTTLGSLFAASYD